MEEYLCPPAVADRAAVTAARTRILGAASRPAVTSVGCATLLRREFLTELFPTAVLPAPAEEGTR